MHSIEKRNHKKLAILLKQQRKIFHVDDLELLWNISNKHTLHSTLHRYTKNNYLIPIQRGLYSTVPLNQLNPIELGSALIHRYTYLTTETVLAQNGIIFQNIPHLTFVSSKTKKFVINSNSYICRQLKDKFLFHPAGVIQHTGYKQATTERAIADLLYFNPKYYFDTPDQIDWSSVKKIQKQIGYL